MFCRPERIQDNWENVEGKEEGKENEQSRNPRKSSGFAKLDLRFLRSFPRSKEPPKFSAQNASPANTRITLCLKPCVPSLLSTVRTYS